MVTFFFTSVFFSSLFSFFFSFFFFFFFFFFSFLRNCFCVIVTTHACGFRAVQRHGSSLAHGVVTECETREIYTYTRELPISLKRRAVLRGTRSKERPTRAFDAFNEARSGPSPRARARARQTGIVHVCVFYDLQLTRLKERMQK